MFVDMVYAFSWHRLQVAHCTHAVATALQARQGRSDSSSATPAAAADAAAAAAAADAVPPQHNPFAANPQPALRPQVAEPAAQTESAVGGTMHPDDAARCARRWCTVSDL
jgi:hypothetical protein